MRKEVSKRSFVLGNVSKGISRTLWVSAVDELGRAGRASKAKLKKSAKKGKQGKGKRKGK